MNDLVPATPVDDQIAFDPVVPTASPSITDAARSRVAAAAENKRAALGETPAAAMLRTAAITRQTGAGRLSATGLEAELGSLSYDAIRERYGDDVGADAGSARYS